MTIKIISRIPFSANVNGIFEGDVHRSYIQLSLDNEFINLKLYELPEGFKSEKIKKSDYELISSGKFKLSDIFNGEFMGCFQTDTKKLSPFFNMTEVIDYPDKFILNGISKTSPLITTNSYGDINLIVSQIPLDTELTVETIGYNIRYRDIMEKYLTKQSLTKHDMRNEIKKLEILVTPRRLREAILGIDNGWLKNINKQIEDLRSKL